VEVCVAIGRSIGSTAGIWHELAVKLAPLATLIFVVQLSVRASWQLFAASGARAAVLARLG